VTAGTNVSVTGSGTSANPYVVNITNGTNRGDMQYWDGTSWVAVTSTNNEGATLQLIDGVPTWTGGTPPVVGDSYQGGVIFYILQVGDPGYDEHVTHGLIAATVDQSTGIQWNNGWSTIIGVTVSELGTGQANTTAIVSKQGTGSYAAQLCNDLELGGYSDWYLPSKDELNKLYLNKIAVGGFVEAYYWSSTEYGFGSAWGQDFFISNQDPCNMLNIYAVRAVRAF